MILQLQRPCGIVIVGSPASASNRHLAFSPAESTRLKQECRKEVFVHAYALDPVPHLLRPGRGRGPDLYRRRNYRIHYH